MARIRTIQPDFRYSLSMGQVSREARLTYVLLWTVVDDEGRCVADPDDLHKILYPRDFDAERYLECWLSELEQEGCIERYAVDDVDYLRIVRWHKHQWIGHPTPSSLPPSPSEPPTRSGFPEGSGRRCRRGRKPKCDQALGERSSATPENGDIFCDDDSPVVVTPQSMLQDFRRIRIRAEADGSHTAALRAAELMGKFAGVRPGADPSPEPLSPSPDELLPRE